MKRLKLLGAQNYTIMALGRITVTRGQEFPVDDDAIAEDLLTRTVRDRANHDWPIFEDVTPERAKRSASRKSTGAKTTTTKRRRRTKAQMSAAAEGSAA